MKKLMIVLIGAVCLLNSSVSASLLGSFDCSLEGGGLSSEVPIGVEFYMSFYVSPSSGKYVRWSKEIEIPPIFPIIIEPVTEISVFEYIGKTFIFEPSDVGETFFISADTPNFDDLVSVLTNGADDRLAIFGLEEYPSHPIWGKIITHKYESYWFRGFLTGDNVDLYGNIIECIGLTINSLEIGIRDTDGKSYWNGDVTFLIYGEPIPEPATVSLLTFGGLMMIRCIRKK